MKVKFSKFLFKFVYSVFLYWNVQEVEFGRIPHRGHLVFAVFAVLTTSSCWKSQFGGAEKVNFHIIVNLGSSDYLEISSDSGTASKQSCALNNEMVGLDGEQKKVLKNLTSLRFLFVWE